MLSLDENIMKAAFEIKKAESILITSGAGMGVDSGLPDFRGPEGFWSSYPPYKKLDMNFYDMANPQTFHTDPALAWGFYGHRLNIYNRTLPHEGFNILKKWVYEKGDNYFIFTSNVDGHFQKAGFDAGKIVECHGSIKYFQCIRPCSRMIFDTAPEIKINHSSMRLIGKPPKCPKCGDILRPNILMFGDFSWIHDRTEEQYSNLDKWNKNIAANRTVVIEIGAGTAVPTVRNFSESYSSQNGLTLIRINPRDYQGSDISIVMSALEALKKIERNI